MLFPYHARHGTGKTRNLKKAYREGNLGVRLRMVAANMVYVNNESSSHGRLADAVLLWTSTRAERSREGGMASLRPPRGSPYLNASKQCWRMGKNDLLNSEYYEIFDNTRKAISEHLRAVWFDLDV